MLVAPTKFVKSHFVINEAFNLSIKYEIPLMILDSELGTKKFIMRLVARITGYSFGLISSGYYKKYPAVFANVEKAYDTIAKAPISHTYIAEWSMHEINNEITRMKLQKNIQVVIYDYLKVENVDSSVKEADVLGNMTNFLKNEIAGNLELAVVALAQLSDYKDMGLRLANSNKIKNYASTVIYMYDKQRGSGEGLGVDIEGNCELFIAFNRNGSQMSQTTNEQPKGINIIFNKKNCTIKEASYQYDEILELAEDEQFDFEAIEKEMSDLEHDEKLDEDAIGREVSEWEMDWD